MTDSNDNRPHFGGSGTTRYTTMAEELLGRVGDMVALAETGHHEEVCRQAFEVLQEACMELFRDGGQRYGSLFAMVDSACRDAGMSGADTQAVQAMRYHASRGTTLEANDLLYDLRALALFVVCTFHVPWPAALRGALPATNRPYESRYVNEQYIRCIVESWDEHCIHATREGGLPGRRIDINYVETPAGIDLTYIASLLDEGMQLNLLGCHTEEDGRVTPSTIVVEPDFLVDISTVAHCFRPYGHHALAYLVDRMGQTPNSAPLLLGNFAGMALDATVHAADHQCDMRQTLCASYRTQALNYSTCPDYEARNFEAQALQQTQNLKQIVGLQLEQLDGYTADSAIVEPTFVCERLGLLGRVDLMTKNFRILVEQKSGKNWMLERAMPEGSIRPASDDHYVQALLYYGVLQANFGVGRGLRMALLYSRYADGLTNVAFYRELFLEALQLRNEIVHNELLLGQGKGPQLLDTLTPETLNTSREESNLWVNYARPQLAATLNPLHDMPPLERAYYHRMMAFTAREEALSKMGSTGHSGGTADLWNMPLAEKRETGNILYRLTISERGRSGDTSGYDLITLHYSREEGDGLPNFRRGDMVYLYSYPRGQEPDVRHSILYKGTLCDMAEGRIVVRLNNGQRSREAIGSDNCLFAMEHGASDVTTTGRMAALHQFISSPPRRRALLLGQRRPETDRSRELSKSYDTQLDAMLLHERQATDYFLLVGPPGTGKTSHAMRYMVEEELSTQGAHVLLLSYTNRAVDEICRMLDGEDGREPIAYLRLGKELSCDSTYSTHLLEHVMQEATDVEEMRRTILGYRVFVSTTATLARNMFLFNLIHFDVAMVDEASQILEPDIVGIAATARPARDGKIQELTAEGQNTPLRCCIDKMVMIGDYKQLPAVVTEPAAESVIEDPLLRAAGFTDCRQSLFERLCRLEMERGDSKFLDTLHRQGRMHPDVADFPSRWFYAREDLHTIPLAHQLPEAPIYIDAVPHDETDRMLMKKRMLFLKSAPCLKMAASDRVNVLEAKTVANLLMSIQRLSGTHFDARRTVGVIVPYRNQIAQIRHEMEVLGLKGFDEVSIDTVERYQGSQRDIILFSATVHRIGQLDFLTANTIAEDGHLIDRKLNVVLTRARKQTIVVGNPLILNANSVYRELIEYVERKQNDETNVDKMTPIRK